MQQKEITESELWTYISKTAESFEKERVERWINSDDYDAELFNKIAGIYKITGENPFKNTSNAETAKQRFFKSVEEVKSKRFKQRNIIKYAAAITLLIAIAAYTYQTFIFASEQVQFQTTYGELRQIDLPDGSVVWLNASSQMSYNEDSSRTIHLEGEAYFEVAEDKNNPFTVETPDKIKVRALGTSFNVKSYSNSDYSETILLTGKVEITSEKYFNNKISMLPGDKVTFYKNDHKIVKTQSESALNALALKEGKVQFKNKPFREIAQDLSIQFNVEIIFENEQISNSKFTGSFDRTIPVAEILEILQASKYFNFHEIGNNRWVIK